MRRTASGDFGKQHATISPGATPATLFNQPAIRSMEWRSWVKLKDPPAQRKAVLSRSLADILIRWVRR